MILGAAAVLVVAVVLAVALPLGVGRLASPGRGGLDAARARARSSCSALGHHVESLPLGDGADAAQVETLLERARERWTTAGSLMSTAQTVAQARLAETAADEGLDLITRACTLLDLPGPAHG